VGGGADARSAAAVVVASAGDSVCLVDLSATRTAAESRDAQSEDGVSRDARERAAPDSARRVCFAGEAIGGVLSSSFLYAREREPGGDFERAKGKGVLFLTGHLGGWELSSFAHSLHGHPLQIVMRGLDNPLVDRLVQSYRTMHGNTVVDKDNFVRGLLGAMKKGETVGILMDTNMTPPQGVFVDFFGIPACTASGLARIALRTDAAVVPGFCVWDAVLRKYRLRFDPAMELIRTGEDDADVLTNTALFTEKIEQFVRKYPEQWLWVHRRWKTRPEGEKGLY